MNRGDLRVVTDDAWGAGFEILEVSDADLAALGYVKLDVDVEQLREALHSYWETTSLVYRVARQVLAALDGEDI